MTMRRRYVDVGDRQVHVGIVGPEPAGAVARPLVLLHQTPRSIDEFAEVAPLLAADRTVVAVDLPGMGASDPPAGAVSIEAMAAGVIGAIEGLGIERCDLVGHHTGGVVALEVAASRSRPGRPLWCCRRRRSSMRRRASAGGGGRRSTP